MEEKMADNKLDFLSHVPLFEGLERRQLQRLANRFVDRSYGPNETIVTQGRGGEGLFTVVSGKAEAIREKDDGTQVVVNNFGPTDFFGEIALLNEGPRTASVIAREDTECLVLTRSDFISVMKADADMGVVISQELAKRLRKALDAFAR
jgi:CRP-like cAMP-binding protein